VTLSQPLPMRARTTAVLALLASLGLGACASPAAPPVAPQRQLPEVTRPGEVLAIPVYDPVERWNRALYAFNARLDRAVVLPVINAYRRITPEFVRNRVTDFFSNLTEITTFANAVLQLKPQTAGRAALRFVDNVLFGFGGLYDIAGAHGEVPQLREDFGQTLGRWGAGDGPYLVLPLLGPSNLRDASGLVVDNVSLNLLFPSGVTNSAAYAATAYVLRPIDLRNSIAFRYYRTGSPFEYDLIRLLYTRTREFEIAK
jgi:phospholipid-binding lipoprotein MlaA